MYSEVFGNLLVGISPACVRAHDGCIAIWHLLFNLQKRCGWRSPVRHGNLNILPLRWACVLLHAFNKLFISQEDLHLELLSRGLSPDAFGHKRCVTLLRRVAALGKVRQ